MASPGCGISVSETNRTGRATGRRRNAIRMRGVTISHPSFETLQRLLMFLVMRAYAFLHHGDPFAEFGISITTGP